MPEYIPKLKWVETWPGDIDPYTLEPRRDFCALVDGAPAGRIRRIEHGPQEGNWHWGGQHPKGWRGTPITPIQGYEETARKACQRAEEYWFAMLKLMAK